METVLLIVAAIALLVIVAFGVMGYLSQSGSAPGLVDGRLAPCPDKPNCVSSEIESDSAHYVEPLVFSGDDAAPVLARVRTILTDMGGRIEEEGAGYLAASFTSSLFRFVDDLEIRIDDRSKTIHLRSASRVGYGDGGVNRKRVEQLKHAFFSLAG